MVVLLNVLYNVLYLWRSFSICVYFCVYVRFSRDGCVFVCAFMEIGVIFEVFDGGTRKDLKLNRTDTVIKNQIFSK